MSGMLPSVATSVNKFYRKSSWKTTITPTIGPFNGKDKKISSRSPSPRKKGYWCRSQQNSAEGTAEVTTKGDESPRTRYVLIGERYLENATTSDQETEDLTKSTEVEKTRESNETVK
ncbi:uncharacterized protein LOC144361816 [Saccoglossus kowalevskii]